jgi:hypothetical protein
MTTKASVVEELEHTNTEIEKNLTGTRKIRYKKTLTLD